MMSTEHLETHTRFSRWRDCWRPERREADPRGKGIVRNEASRVLLGQVGGELWGRGDEGEPHTLSPGFIHVTAAEREKTQG